MIGESGSVRSASNPHTRRKVHNVLHTSERSEVSRNLLIFSNGLMVAWRLCRHFIMNDKILPLGKLPAPLLARLLARAPVDDPRIVVGPGVGLDCAVVELGDTLLVCKSDPITFVSGEVGRYLVQVNANDVATAGATPCWLPLFALDQSPVEPYQGGAATTIALRPARRGLIKGSTALDVADPTARDVALFSECGS